MIIINCIRGATSRKENSAIVITRLAFANAGNTFGGIAILIMDGIHDHSRLLADSAAAALYVRTRAKDIRLLKGLDSLEVTAEKLPGGNVNFSYKIMAKGGGDWGPVEHTFFLKQAPPFVAVMPNIPLTKDRMIVEHGSYVEWAACLKGTNVENVVPEVYYFDQAEKVLISEFCEAYQELDALLASWGPWIDDVSLQNALAEASSQIGLFSGTLHSKTHAALVSGEITHRLRTQFSNEEMRNVQIEFVFEKCFRDVVDDEAKVIFSDQLMKRVNALKARYASSVCGSALCHGDMHAGSLMCNLYVSAMNPHTLKVIDPEFAVYGPPELDLGSVFSSFMLTALRFSVDAKANYKAWIAQLGNCIALIWKNYSNVMLIAGLSPRTLAQISFDAAGYASVEVIRTLLGCAGKRSTEFGNANLVERGLKMCERILLAQDSKESNQCELLLLGELERL